MVLISRWYPFQDGHSCQNKVQGPWSLILDTWYLIFDPWYLILDTWYLIHDPWYLILDRWSLILDPWSLIHDPWSMILASCHPVCLMQYAVMESSHLIRGCPGFLLGSTCKLLSSVRSGIHLEAKSGRRAESMFFNFLFDLNRPPAWCRRPRNPR